MALNIGAAQPGGLDIGALETLASGSPAPPVFRRFNLSDTTPASPASNLNVKWQFDSNGNVSGYVPVPASGGGGGGHVIQEEGLSLAQRAKLNFTGTGVVVTDDAANDTSVVTIAGASSTAALSSAYYPIGAATGSSTALGTGWSQPSAGGASIAAAGTTYRAPYLQFTSAADQFAFLVTRFADDYDGSAINVDLAWFSSAAAGLLCRWSVEYSILPVGGTAIPTTDPTWTSGGIVNAASPGANLMAVTRITFTPAGTAAGHEIKFRIKRVGTADTLGVGANMFGAQVQYKRIISVSGGGAVASVFSRTGIVVAQVGDYNAAQVTNAVSTLGSYADPAWITSLAWGKIAGKPTWNSDSTQAQTKSAFLIWQNFRANNNHVIFDASSGLAPDGVTAVNQTDAADGGWQGAAFPNLMGWNGGATYTVRVGNARSADRLANMLPQTADSYPVASQILHTMANGQTYVSSLYGNGQATFAGPVTATSASDIGIVVQSTGAIQTAYISIIGRQTNMDSAWHIVSSGAGMGPGDLRFVRDPSWAATPKMTIAASGNVGIGTSTPATILHCYKRVDGGNTVISIDNDSAVSPLGAGLEFRYGATGVLGGVYHSTASGTDWSLRFKAWNNSAATERMCIIGASGNVGIGTGNPTASLHAYNASAGYQIKLESPLRVWGLGVYGGTGNLGIDDVTGGASRVVISTGGNVLINTGTDDGANKLQVNGSIKATGNVQAAALVGGQLSLPTTAAATQLLASLGTSTASNDRIEIDAYRETAGSGWDTASWRIARMVDVSRHGQIKFTGGSYTNISGAVGAGIVFGFGSTDAIELIGGPPTYVKIITKVLCERFTSGGAADDDVVLHVKELNGAPHSAYGTLRVDTATNAADSFAVVVVGGAREAFKIRSDGVIFATLNTTPNQGGGTLKSLYVDASGFVKAS